MIAAGKNNIKAAQSHFADLKKLTVTEPMLKEQIKDCLLYTSDAADERSSVDLGGRRIIKKKNREKRSAVRLQHRHQPHKLTTRRYTLGDAPTYHPTDYLNTIHTNDSL